MLNGNNSRMNYHVRQTAVLNEKFNLSFLFYIIPFRNALKIHCVKTLYYFYSAHNR